MEKVTLLGFTERQANNYKSFLETLKALRLSLLPPSPVTFVDPHNEMEMQSRSYNYFTHEEYAMPVSPVLIDENTVHESEDNHRHVLRASAPEFIPQEHAAITPARSVVSSQVLVDTRPLPALSLGYVHSHTPLDNTANSMGNMIPKTLSAVIFGVQTAPGIMPGSFVTPHLSPYAMRKKERSPLTSDLSVHPSDTVSGDNAHRTSVSETSDSSSPRPQTQLSPQSPFDLVDELASLHSLTHTVQILDKGVRLLQRLIRRFVSAKQKVKTESDFDTLAHCETNLFANEIAELFDPPHGSVEPYCKCCRLTLRTDEVYVL